MEERRTRERRRKRVTADAARPAVSGSLGPVVVLAVLLAGMATSGCEHAFQPLKENSRFHFSIYGYLDASADTQWVRVTPVREQLNMEEVIPDMRVTLEDLQSGTTVELNDSLFLRGRDFRYLNFWTAADIEHGGSYLLKAENGDGATSEVTVTVPDELPTPRLQRITRNINQGPAYILYVTGVEHLADVQSVWYVLYHGPGFELKKTYSFSHRTDSEQSSAYGGSIQVYIDPDEELEEIISSSVVGTDLLMEVVYRQVYVASAGPEWNEEIDTLGDLEYALPGRFSNVEGGLGYMVGIDSKWIPFESCYTPQSQLIPCPEEEPFW